MNFPTGTVNRLIVRRLKPLALLAAVLAGCLLMQSAHAQAPFDEQLAKAQTALTNAFEACSAKKFTECIRVETSPVGFVSGTLTRTVNGGTESTEFKAIPKLTDQDAQAVFKIEAESYSTPPTNNVPPVEFWRYEKFSTGQSPTENALLQAWLAPNLDSTNGSGFGFLVCGNLTVNFGISLFGSTRDVTLVNTTQSQLKGLMQETAQALQAAGACGASQAPPSSAFPGPYPTLATISEMDNLAVTIFPKGFSQEGRRFGKTGYELQWGDRLCFKGLGTLKLKWFDGSTIELNDPAVGRTRGRTTLCLELALTRPNDIPAPGIAPRAGQFILDYVSNLGGFVRMVVHAATPPSSDEPEGRFRASTHSAVLAIKGTSFIMGEGADGQGYFCVEEGVVAITPRNTSLAPFDLTAGNQVQISADAVSPTSAGCELPAANSIAQPKLNAAGMTLQAAQRFGTVGEIVRVPIWLIQSENLANLNLELDYDPAVIQPDGNLDNARGNLLENALFKPNAAQEGRILVGFAQTSGIQSAVGTVIEIPFRVVGKPGDVSPLLLNVTAINDPSGGALNIDRIHGQVVVVNEDGTLPGTGDDNAGGGGGAGGSGGANGGTGGSSGANPGGIQPGDCDGSGGLNELDALCALEMSVGLRPERSYVDVDQSGLPITSRDAVVILQRAVGQ